jgi:hypothetical protein
LKKEKVGERDARFDFDIEARELDSVSLSATLSLAPYASNVIWCRRERAGERDHRALNNFRMFSSYMARMANYVMSLKSTEW